MNLDSSQKGYPTCLVLAEREVSRGFDMGLFSAFCWLLRQGARVETAYNDELLFSLALRSGE